MQEAMQELNFRQIHLDFHTSENIPGIGADFDAEEFAQTLEKARVNSITCFARCHHGYIYYDSKTNPERIHPHLERKNLLIEQIEACHKRGIRVPIYTTVQWDEYTADRQRDWLMIDQEGREYGTKPFDAGFYRNLDVFHPGYRQFLYDHVKELFETMPVDGIFFDIVQNRQSVAMHWLDAMDNQGFNPEDEGDRQRFAAKVHDEWALEMTEFCRGYSKDCTLFYNSGHVGPRHRTAQAAYSHWELESLPSGGWGYLHFPQTMRYARGLNKDCLGMTGKFHTSWGDFHSFKNPAALQFECFQMLALGAKCSIGDQLHPSGKIDEATYDLIGGVYTEVEQKEAWCKGAQSLNEIGVLTPEEFVMQRAAFNAKSDRDVPSVMGAVRMLQELRLQFDILDTQRDFSGYKLLILPDEVPVDEALAEKLENYLADGGSVIASYHSGLGFDGAAFTSKTWGVSFKNDAPFSPDFIVPGELKNGLPDTGHVMYMRALEVEAQDGAQVLSHIEIPYFNRTWRHFCSHRHTPSKGEQSYPGVTKKGRVIYFAHPIFAQYQNNAPRWCKQLVSNAIDLLLPEKLVQIEGPSSLLSALNEQSQEARRILHLLHYIPERRGQAFDIIEDVIPLFDVRVSIAGEAKSVKLVPAGESLKFLQHNGRVHFVVPKLVGHAMIEIA
ncbi:MAG TPA: beta-galactosidase trimerization domain-containing protein [Abditibacteriaceae bacterium]|jgi:hypothetical protein